jgi:hypothetical protein
LSGTTVAAAAVDAAGNAYVGTLNQGVYKQVHGSQTWVSANKGITAGAVRALVSDASGNLYAGTRAGGIYKSTDSGASWVPVANGLADAAGRLPDVRVLALGPNGTLYAGTDGDGVYVSQNGGGNWSLLNDGLTNLAVYSLVVDSKSIYAGTKGSGVFKLDLPAAPTPWVTTATVSGSLANQTITAVVTPDAADLGQTGCVFFGAIAPGGSIFLLGGGWQALSADHPASYAAGALAKTQATLASGLNLNQLAGTALYAGYGLGASNAACLADMLKRGQYKPVYTLQ